MRAAAQPGAETTARAWMRPRRLTPHTLSSRTTGGSRTGRADGCCNPWYERAWSDSARLTSSSSQAGDWANRRFVRGAAERVLHNQRSLHELESHTTPLYVLTESRMR
jgi:hypothetical protein